MVDYESIEWLSGGAPTDQLILGQCFEGINGWSLPDVFSYVHGRGWVTRYGPYSDRCRVPDRWVVINGLEPPGLPVKINALQIIVDLVEWQNKSQSFNDEVEVDMAEIDWIADRARRLLPRLLDDDEFKDYKTISPTKWR